jgi:hypothetical protein
MADNLFHLKGTTMTYSTEIIFIVCILGALAIGAITLALIIFIQE